MIEIKCSTKDALHLSEITEFQGNLKERDSTDYEKIERSIRKHGFSFPFFIWKHDGVNHCLDGHGRLGTLQRMVAGGEQIPPLPVVYVNCKNEADAKEMLLKLNSTYGHMTADSVREFLRGGVELDIDFEDLALPEGILDFSIDDVMKDTAGDDDAPEVEIEEAVSKPGEIYELGAHRLMCGDSTSADDMARLMGENKADLIITDPPYNVDYKGKTAAALKIDNDNMGDNAFLNFLTDAFSVMFGALKAGGAFYIWHADSEVKTSIIYEDKPARSEAHPTMKPVRLFERLIMNSSKAEDVVLDPFGGSGTTIIAAAKTNRIARVMELDPHYCDVIRKRWTAWAKENGKEIGSGKLE